jgi:Flp pilus assembly protein TadG
MKYLAPVQRQRRRNGTGFVEFALVAPILLALVMGIIDFGWMERNTLIISNATREGARAASLGQLTANIRTRIINAAIPPFPQEAASTGVISNGSIVMQQGVTNSSDVTTYSAWPADSGSKNGVMSGNLVRITVNYTHRSITGLFNRSVSIQFSMRREA